MTRAVTITVLLSVLWCIGGAWYYNCKIKRVCGPETTAEVQSEVQLTPPEPATQTSSDPRAESPVPMPSKPLTLTAYFGRKSTGIMVSPVEEAKLKELLTAVAQGRRLLVAGHSDSRGQPELKAELSAQRALILRDWLIAHGAPATAIAAVESREDREPVADNTTAEGRALNRRATATLAPQE